jgi:hypothetical protein
MKVSLVASLAVLAAALGGGAGWAQPADSPPPAAGPSPREACAADVKRLCADTQPGGGQVMQCMRQHRDELSDSCKSALMAARANHHWRHDGSSEGSPPNDGPPPQTGAPASP